MHAKAMTQVLREDYASCDLTTWLPRVSVLVRFYRWTQACNFFKFAPFIFAHQGRLNEAAEESKVAVEILEATCGRDHPLVMKALNNYAMLLGNQV